ncbi:histidinol-phosphate aminotransferase family protein [Polaribacter sp. BAL334]|uniref:pyridoxal phosphate-dependent aminotransferase n=1 Tax=Polaribacter sp. BAL334 TaxID=1708178 RepID=UPI0018D20030|nr:histidinol-phosphate transaminase [Polaribacter sp. BAL334]MBG7611682.1 histidinol-phosphate aminotransferase family protein [Polaribacter sp. BAL334]
MNTTNFSRRDWLKKSTLTLGALTLIPSEIWTNNVLKAQSENSPFLYNSSNYFNEFTPPIVEENESLVILRANENPYGPPPKAAKAFQDEVFTGNRYSWKTLDDLMETIAKNEGVKTDQILMAPGSSDILEKVAMVLFQNGGNVISADPSYMSLMIVAKAVGGQWKSYKLLDDSQHDLDAMEAGIDADTKLVYICNPNNPTGSITDAKKLRDFCSRVSEKVPVFVDEAYIELSKNGLKDSMNTLVAEGKNVIVARTFSKIHGMAGLRIGYAIGKKETLDSINEITRGGMGITGPSIAAASASLANTDFLDDCRAKITAAREYTISFLETKKFSYLPSETNFVIFEIPMEGKEFLQKIYAKNVAVRSFKFWDKNWCRVSIGTMDEMKLFTKAMGEIFA